VVDGTTTLNTNQSVVFGVHYKAVVVEDGIGICVLRRILGSLRGRDKAKCTRDKWIG